MVEPGSLLLFVILIRGSRSLFEFPAGLVEQLLGFRGMSIQVPLIGALSRLDFFKGLVAQALRGSQVGVSFRTDVFGRWFHLRED